MKRCNPTVVQAFIGGALIMGSSSIEARSIGMEYATEWLTDFNGGYDWINMLKASLEVDVCPTLKFQASTISTSKIGDETLIDDLLTFSNIEAGNIPLTISRAGLALTIKNAELFAGINNVNEDYFTSELTSYFTNSSCGISPTISCNYDIANYPNASWCIHYRQTIGNFSAQTSLYPGRGYHRLAGHDNLFSLNIKRDGLLSISSFDYKRNGIYSVFGIALHHGVSIGDEDGEPLASASLQASSPQKKFSVAPWLLTEINLPHNIGLHAHISMSTVTTGCKAYGGIGVIYTGKHVQPGVSMNYASFTDSREFAAEIGTRIPLYDDKAYLQPTIHVVKTSNDATRCIGMLRFNLTL